MIDMHLRALVPPDEMKAWQHCDHHDALQCNVTLLCPLPSVWSMLAAGA